RRNHPETPIPGPEDRATANRVQALFHRKCGYRKLTKAVESARCSDPDVAFLVLKNSPDLIARKAVELRERIEPPMMYMDNAGGMSSDPNATAAITQKTGNLWRLGGQRKGIDRFRFSIHHSNDRTAYTDQKSAIVVRRERFDISAIG